MVQGALKAAHKIIKYLALNKDLCLHQPWGADSDAFEWQFDSDSDQSSNAEVKNKRRSQLSHIAVRGYAPVMFGSNLKASSVHFGTDLDGFGVSHYGLDKPTCHPDMSDIHADVSSAAAEVYRATPDIRTQPLEPRDTRSGLWILEPTRHSSQVLWTQDRQS